MCGIAVMCGNDWARTDLERMVGALSHRGPDAQGLHVDPSGQVGLGHTRLSILDLSDAGRQPMSDSSGRFWITFNGEIYNYLELRQELQAEYTFRSGTDTEVLLAAFRKWGSGCLNRLIGMFAFAIWDQTERRLFVARDRFGVKPLYYHLRPGSGIWLASEIKALHAAGVDRVPEAPAWASYLASGLYDHDTTTFWRSIQQLPPGSHLTWRAGAEPIISSWYDVARSVLAQTGETRPE